jgi:hypothetical protein
MHHTDTFDEKAAAAANSVSSYNTVQSKQCVMKYRTTSMSQQLVSCRQQDLDPEFISGP